MTVNSNNNEGPTRAAMSSVLRLGDVHISVAAYGQAAIGAISMLLFTPNIY